MSAHGNLRFILKTSDGYLTKTGTQDNICSENILALNVFEVGGEHASRDEIIKKFLDCSSLAVDENECEVLCFTCQGGESDYLCEQCRLEYQCDFWEHRESMKFRLN